MFASFFSLKSDSRTCTCITSPIVTTGTSFTAPLWQKNLPLFTLQVPTILQLRSVLIPYGSLDLVAITYLGVSA